MKRNSLCAKLNHHVRYLFFCVPQSNKMLFRCDEKLSNKAKKKSQLNHVPHTCNAHKLTVFLYIGLHKSLKLGDVPCFKGRYAATSVKKWAPTVRKAKLYCSSLNHDASQHVWNLFRLSNDHLHEKRNTVLLAFCHILGVGINIWIWISNVL